MLVRIPASVTAMVYFGQQFGTVVRPTLEALRLL